MGCCQSKVNDLPKKKAVKAEDLNVNLNPELKSQKSKSQFVTVDKGKVGERYKIIKVIAETKHGSVYHVMDMKNSIEKCLKEFNKSKNKSRMQQILNTVETLKQLVFFI